jgi:diguanylate cyclase (GGDEF)-like protein
MIRLLPQRPAPIVCLAIATLASATMALAASPACAQSSFARGTPLHWPAVLTGAFIGFLLLSAAYNIAFFSILRERFLLWQTARVLILIGLTISMSSLPLGSWLAADGMPRQIVINVLFDSTIAMLGLFLRAVLEPGMIDRRIDRLLLWQPLAIAATTPAMMLGHCPPLYMALRDAVLVGVLVLLCASLAQAVGRGSRAARFQTAAWFCVLLVGLISLYHDIVLGRPFALLLYALFSALAVEMLVTSIGIGDRFMRLKRHHDTMSMQAIALERVAYTDAMTGLENRRSLERQFIAHRPRAIAIVDIDHFKRINDRHGHDRGDKVIIAVAAGLCTGEVFTARLGGEEFALLLYGPAPLETVETLLGQLPQRVMASVADLDFPVTASAGVASVTAEMTVSDALKAADVRLYAAKAAGRNQLVGSSPAHIRPRVA